MLYGVQYDMMQGSILAPVDGSNARLRSQRVEQGVIIGKHRSKSHYHAIPVWDIYTYTTRLVVSTYQEE
jgi:hypothetical protein